MNYKLPLKLALSILRTKQIRKKQNDEGMSATHNLAGTIAAIALSLMPILVVLEVTNGMIEGISSRFLEVGSYHMRIKIYEDIPPARLVEIQKGIGELKNIKYAFLERQGLGLIYSERGRSGTIIRAVPDDLYGADAEFAQYFSIKKGEFNLEGDFNILLGTAIAQQLAADIGDTVKILTVRIVRDRTFLPKITRFTVTGIFSTGYQELDRQWVYIPYETGVGILPEKMADQFIGIKVDNPHADLKSIVNDLGVFLSQSVTLYNVKTWYDLEENQYRSFQTMKYLLVFIMFLIIFVACFNVSSTMVMIVMEKTEEIGILKSIGARPFSISAAYIITGFIIGVTGFFTGLAAGLILAVNINAIIRGIEGVLNIAAGSFFNLVTLGRFQETVKIVLLDSTYYLESIPVRINFLEIAGIGLFTILLTSLAAYFPARQAGKIKPLKVLRKI